MQTRHASSPAAGSAKAVDAPTTPDERSTAFQAVEGGPEQHSGTTLLVEAYAVLWVILMAWLAPQWQRQGASARAWTRSSERSIARRAKAREEVNGGQGGAYACMAPVRSTSSSSPASCMIGIVVGYILGTRPARDAIEKKRRRNRRVDGMIDFEHHRGAKGPHRDRPALRARSASSPSPAECDRESRFPRDVFEDAWKIGLVNPTLPAEFGGAGLSDLDSAFITEELAYGCSGIQTSMTANTLGLTPIKLAGSAEQKKKYLGWLASEPIFASYATTEPGAGSDVAGIQTRATKDGERRLRPQRPEGVDHERQVRLVHHDLRDGGPGAAPQGDRRVHRPPRRGRGEGRQARGQARPAREQHRRRDARGRARPRGAGARAAGPRVQARDGDVQPDAARHRRDRASA